MTTSDLAALGLLFHHIYPPIMPSYAARSGSRSEEVLLELMDALLLRQHYADVFR
jgi:hypothetical protein